jgi:hypothetical protein
MKYRDVKPLRDVKTIEPINRLTVLEVAIARVMERSLEGPTEASRSAVGEPLEVGVVRGGVPGHKRVATSEYCFWVREGVMINPNW